MTEIVLQVIFWVLLFGFISESIWARYNLKCQNKGRVTVKNIFFVIGMLFLLGGCDDAMVANRNMTKAADNFEVNRRIVFYNGITDKYILVIEGRCSITDSMGQLEVLCKTGDSTYKKHFLGLSDNVTYFAEQLDDIKLSVYHYRVTFKPEVIIPDIRKQ